MATRYYPTEKSPGSIIHGPMLGSWGAEGGFSVPFSPVQQTTEMSTSKTNGGILAGVSFRTNQQGDYDFPLYRLMTPPLAAQNISGTVDLCFMRMAEWEDAILPPSNDSVVRFKLHVYATIGQSATLRATLLSNHVDSVDWPTSLQFASLASAQSLTATDIQEGDCIMVELGCRVVSSPTPAPTYPPTNMTHMPFWGLGTTNGSNVAYADATPGDVTVFAPWIEFSDTITEASPAAPPANDACADAVVVGSIPYVSEFINTTQSADTDRAVWWTFTAPESGTLCVDTRGGNFNARATVYTGGCGALVSQGTTFTLTALHRSLSFNTFTVVGGTQYWVKIATLSNAFTAPTSGGVARLNLYYKRTPPENDDLFVPCRRILQLRGSTPVNMSLSSAAWTGVGIDYTRTPMTEVSGGATNTNDRLLLGIHGSDLLEIFDIDALDEVDWITDPFGSGLTQNPAQIVVTSTGLAYTAWFGNGYLYVGGSGTLPAVLNTVSDTTVMSEVKAINAYDGDNQAGAPYAYTAEVPSPQVTAAWATAFDEATSILYYTSGGVYVPVGGTLIKRYNVATNTQLADFATVSLQAGNNPGIKGITLLPDGGLLVCNSTVVQRLNSAGAVVTTYTPSIAMDSTTLMDCRLVMAGTQFWVIDLFSTRMFRFDLNSGVELETYQPYLEPGTLLQMAVFVGETPPTPFVTARRIRRRQRIFPHLSEEQIWAFHKALQIDMETGVGLGDPEDPTAYNPKVMLDWSDDGGHTWSNVHEKNIGKMGEYKHRVFYRMLGRSRDRIYRLTMSDPVRAYVIAGYLDAEAGTS